MWLRLEKSALWIGPGVVSLILFVVLLTRIDVDFARRAYAAYGGVYVAASIASTHFVEGTRPDRWDFLGAAIMLVGAGIVILGPRRTHSWRRDKSRERSATVAWIKTGLDGFFEDHQVLAGATYKT